MNELPFLPPALILLAGALLISLTRGRLRTLVVLAAPLLTFWAVWMVPDGVVTEVHFLDYDIQPVEGSAVRRLFAATFALMAFAGGLFAFRQARWYEVAAAYAYASGAVGVSFAGDLITVFIFWELMALFSVIVVWSGGTKEARAAGLRYVVLHLIGGVILKVGIEGVAVHTGSIEFQPIAVTNFDTWMILIGILINAAAPPISAWLPDAYPRASATGAVFLSAFTTKTAVLVLILMFPGEQVLIWVGLYMIFYGIIYALLENDARRILAYSIVNQVGFMVCAVGIGTEMALNGAAAHAVAHIFYKALLFMSAGVVLHRTGLSRCTDLGGLFRTMPLTTFCGLVGAFSISSFPLTSGFTTKTLISEAAHVEGLAVVYFLLAAASAGVFLHAGIKFPWFVFFQKDSGLRPKDAPWNMAAAMLLLVAICFLLGFMHQWFYLLLPYPVEYAAYTPYKVLFYLQLLLFSGLAFFLMLPWMRRTLTISLDFDWLWRVGLIHGVPRSLAALADLRAALVATAAPWVAAGVRLGQREVGAGGRLSQTWPIGTTVLWVLVLFTGYVLIYYL